MDRSPRPMQRGFSACALAAVLLLPLAACDDTPTTSVKIRRENVRSFVRPALAGDGLPLSVYGRPYDTPENTTAAAVAIAMTRAMTWTRDPRLVVTEDGTNTVRIVAVFNSEAQVNPCADTGADGGPKGGGPKGGGPAADGAVRLALALCSGSDALSHVTGRLGESDGLDDRRFAKLIQQATTDLLTDEHHR